MENVMFGCGHWNTGLFHRAAGLLGLGRGAMSFSLQLQSIYGNSFSYYLEDRNSDGSVSSKLIFGEDKDLFHPGQVNLGPWGGPQNLGRDVAGGFGWLRKSINSDTTLSYFAEAAYNNSSGDRKGCSSRWL
ncbi:hypothetical protein MLD38_033277 [Melastoma candidum]|uniref:Uncharacterized protein n=1 Tax=Melastoma candidum TaxID=119954 RepID=A0ACB9M611_9MYRT|nr:hypothetical protein MLD38_033277 [Melastoma candidum]